MIKEDTNELQKDTLENSSSNVSKLLQIAQFFLEDKDWDKAKEYFKKVINLEPNNYFAYIGEFMTALHINSIDELVNTDNPFEENNSFKNAMKYADESQKAELLSYIEKKDKYCSDIYDEAKKYMQLDQYEKAASVFKTISRYHDSKFMENKCHDLDKVHQVYVSAKMYMAKGKFFKASEIFKDIKKYKDSDNLFKECCEKAVERQYDFAKKNMSIGEYKNAESIFREIIEYKDSASLIKECRDKEKKTIFEKYHFVKRIENKFYERLAIYKNKLEKYNTENASLVEELNHLSIFSIGKKEFIKNRLEFLDNRMLTLSQKINDEIDKINEIEKFISSYCAKNNFKDNSDIDDSLTDEEYDTLFSKLIKEENYKKLVYKLLKIGNCVKFGKYNYDLIEWIVIDKDKDNVLLLSRYAIDSMRYDERGKETSWEKCSLRKWLNGDFLNKSFTKDEREIISAVELDEDKTIDNVFVLSKFEVKKYLYSDEIRKCKPTEYALANGIRTDQKNNCCWWLRSIGRYLDYASYVAFSGTSNDYGLNVNVGYNGIRPALWIKL